MALSKHHGEVSFSSDVMQQRLGAGTVARDHVQQSSLTANNFTNIVDDQDPEVKYFFTGAVGIDEYAADFTDVSGSQTVIGGVLGTGAVGMGASFRFRGNKIGVLGQTSPTSGSMQVYIDGVLTPGRMFNSISLTPAGPNLPALASGSSLVTGYGDITGFPASGQLMIGSEIVTYSSCSNGYPSSVSTFTLTSPTQVPHYVSDPVYYWGHTVNLGTSTDYTHRKLLYYNPLLEDKEHYINIVTAANGAGNARIFFDGFVTGSLLGTGNIFTQIGTVTKTFTTDANGYFLIGALTQSTPDVQPIGILGYNQRNPSTLSSSTNKLGQLQVGFDSVANQFYLLYYNGPASTSVTIVVTFSYIAQSV